MGENCRYDGNNNEIKEIELLSKKYKLIPFCPEVESGMSTPRSPAERVGDRVINKKGEDVTDFFKKGALLALETAKKNDCKIAILKERSPSCGYGKIYDGNFDGTLVLGNGLTAEILSENGIEVYGESSLQKLL